MDRQPVFSVYKRKEKNQIIAVKVIVHKVLDRSGPSGFLTFRDLYGLDTDILITFLSVLRIYTDLYALVDQKV